MTTKRVLGLISVAMASVLGCNDFGPTMLVVPAFIIFYGDTAMIAAPDTVDRGDSFDVRVETFGGGCTRSTAGADVTLRGQIAEVRPHNLAEVSRGTVCTLDVLFLTHVVSLRFDSAGPATVRVIGQNHDGTTSVTDVPDTLERRIIVR